MFDYGTRQLIEQTLLVFAALFPIVNPVGGAPVFLAMTHGLEDAQRRLLARRIAFNAFLLVMGSIFVGNYVIEFFGLSVPVIQVGGGLLVCALAWRLLHSDETADQIRIGPRSSGSAEQLPGGILPALHGDLAVRNHGRIEAQAARSECGSKALEPVDHARMIHRAGDAGDAGEAAIEPVS